MLANFLEKSKPINFIVCLGCFFSFFIITVLSNFYEDTYTWYKVLESILSLFLFLSILFFYNFVVTKNKLTFDNSYALFLFILAIIALLPKLLELNVLLLAFIHLLFLRKIYSLRSDKKVIQKIFDSGFLLGVLCILEPFSILFFFLIYTALLLHKKGTINTLIIPIIGFITPLIVYFTFLLWNDSTDVFVNLFNLNKTNGIFIDKEGYTLWFFSSLILLSIFSIFLKSPKAFAVNNSFKKNWGILIINLIIALIFTLVIPEKDGSEIILLIIPASIIIANGFEVLKKKILRNILLTLLIIATVTGFFYL